METTAILVLCVYRGRMHYAVDFLNGQTYDGYNAAAAFKMLAGLTMIGIEDKSEPGWPMTVIRYR